MSSVFQLLMSLFRITILLGMGGTLVDATLAMGHKAANAQRFGLVSLAAINRQIMFDSHVKHHDHVNNK